MAENSSIQWTTHTFNPWRGCTKVSEGCAHCYAETLSKRSPGTLGTWGPRGQRVVAAESYWRQPVRWDAAAQKAGERHRVFCASLADVFEAWTGPMSAADGRLMVKPPLDRESGPENWMLEYPDVWEEGDHQGWRLLTMEDVRRRLFDLICRTPYLDWLLLTKRPENALQMMVDAGLYAAANPNLPCPQPNVWLGTSVEDQQRADERIPHLLRCPAAVRFLSCEPLLGPVSLSGIGSVACPVHWVIVGGESGPHARFCDVAWIRSIRDQCRAAGVPFFLKQFGSQAGISGDHDALLVAMKDRKGGDPAEWPADLRDCREFPVFVERIDR